MLLPVRLAVGAAMLTSQIAYANDATIPSDMPISQLLSSATAHLAAGRSSDALAYYDAAISRDPDDYLTIFKRGAAYLSLGRSVQASRDFDSVLKIRPGFEGALIQRAKIKTRDGEWSSAKQDWLDAGRNVDAPEITELDEAEAAVTLAEEAEKAGNWDDCIAQAGVAIQKAAALVKLRDLRSRCRFEKGDVASAVTDLQHVLHLKSGDTEPHLRISALTFYALGETDKGLAQIRKCLQSDPDNKPCRSLMRREKAFDRQYKKLNQLLEKKSYASSVRLLIPSSEDPGLLKEAAQDFDDLKKEGMIHEKASNGLHDILTEKACQSYVELKRWPKAKAFCEAALEKDPTSEFGLMSKAKLQMDGELYEDAVRTLKEAAEAHEGSNTVRQMLNEANTLLQRSKQKDYYKVLGVSRDADEREIKRAYRKLVKEHHPDKAAARGVPKDVSQAKIAAINEAYETLKDPELKARVDRGEDPNDPQQQQGGHPFHGSPFGHGGQQFQFRSGGGFGGGSGGFQFQFPGGAFPGGFPGGFGG